MPAGLSDHPPVPGPVTIRPATTADAPSVALLHAGQIAEGFLSLLGPAFLRRLYRRICLTPASFLLAAEEDGRVVGFVAGSADVGRLYRAFLWRDGIPAGASVAPRLVANWRRVLETLRHGSSGTGTDGVELLSIAVAPSHQKQGIGEQLVTSFLEVADRAGAGGAYVVVAADNQSATSLYRRTGFLTASSFELHAGATSLIMRNDRPGDRASHGHGPS